MMLLPELLKPLSGLRKGLSSSGPKRPKLCLGDDIGRVTIGPLARSPGPILSCIWSHTPTLSVPVMKTRGLNVNFWVPRQLFRTLLLSAKSYCYVWEQAVADLAAHLSMGNSHDFSCRTLCCNLPLLLQPLREKNNVSATYGESDCQCSVPTNRSITPC